ncbi:MAG: hypothetical protein BHV90_22750 [Clostridiales bacterium 42_27]|nr:MAG: hypothetical protein BHV90_22750 [Clostridiales bacterium 42_27]DAT24458.1 MAG TPA: Preprotein translocase subunit SecB [Caudoviricetes sp.]
MINNFSGYFENKHDIFLEDISYSRLETNITTDCSLNCTDNINAQLIENQGIKLVVTRALEFEPESIFSMKVAFGAKLYFKEDKMKAFDWSQLNLAEEFRENGDFVINELMSRITLMIAQITASFGQVPLILPPLIPTNDRKDK